MVRIKIMVFVAVMALLWSVPATTFAQAAPALPHRFFGTAMVDSTSVADGTIVTAVLDGEKVAEATTRGGSYRLDVIQPQGRSYTGKTVTFVVRGSAAAQTARWALGGVTHLDLTATPSLPGIASTLAPLGANLVRVWGYEAGNFRLYDPGAPPEVNDLTRLTRGRAYWINVRTAQTATLGSVLYTLSAGWNLIGWLG